MIPLYWPAHILISLLSPLFFPLTIKGRENIPAQGSFIAACNHVSNIDPPLVSYAVHRPIYHIAKNSLFKNIAFAGLLYGLGSFPIKREGSDVGAMRECLRKLKAGFPLAMFPTGTRIAGQQALTAKGGIGFLSAKANVPVIPVKIAGTDHVMPKGAKTLHRHPVTIIIGGAIQKSAAENYEEFAARILKAIVALS